MGDSVERALEETIPILRTAQRLKLLSPTEIRSVVQRRRDHEYAVSNRKASRSAFLKYAAFEKELANALSTRAKSRGIKKKKSLHVVGKSAARVNLVYSRAVRRFPGDADLWLHYARYCLLTGSLRAAGRVFANALGFRGDSEEIWLAAMSYHFDTCGDARGARALAQRALRALPSSVMLWKEYYRMEVCYLAKLLSRRVAMGLKPSTGGGDGEAMEQNKVGTEESATSKGPDEDADKNQEIISLGDSNVQSSGVASKEPTQNGTSRISFWEGGVPITVLNCACKTITFSPANLSELWDITVATPFVPTSLVHAVLKLLQKMFPSSVVVRLFGARIPLDVALIKYRTQKAAHHMVEEGENGNGKSQVRTDVGEAVVMKAASDVLGDLKGVLKQFGDGHNGPESDGVCKCIESYVSLTQSADIPAVAIDVQALRSFVPTGENGKQAGPLGESITSEALDMANPKSWSLGTLIRVLGDEESSPNNWSNEVFEVVKEKLLVPFRDATHERALRAWITRETQAERLRDIAEAILTLPPLRIETLHDLIRAELRIWSATEKDGRIDSSGKDAMVKQTRKLFGRAISLPPATHHLDLWLDFVAFESGIACNPTEASMANWKAMKTLDPNSRELFCERQTLRNLAV